MNRQAIYHRTYSEYSFATSRERVVLRLRAAKGDLDACFVCYGDRMDPHSPIKLTRQTMIVRFSDELFDYYELAFNPHVTRLCYYFELHKGKEKVYYYNDGFFQVPHENRQLYYNFHYIRQEDMADVPEWFKQAVIYQIYPDSFATSANYISAQSKEIVQNGHYFHSQNGGTLRGITENVPYLQKLGINCLYLTPIFAANSWHKYDTVDYFAIDPCFGDKTDLQELVATCHQAGIRVILDGVFNHSGPDFFAFQDLLAKGANSAYRDWFFPYSLPLQRGPKPNYECFAYFDFMPKLNTGNPEVMQYFQKVGRYWIEEFDIDGWRLDVANEIDHNFWREFRKAIRSVKNDAVLIAEIWDDARSFLEGEQFDGAMNYNLTFAIVDAIAKQEISAEALAWRSSYLLMRYPEAMQQAQMNLIDSHDVPRFLALAHDNVDKLKLAALFLLTHVGAPLIFYGDEQGISGLAEIDYRKPMIWQNENTDLFVYYQKLIALRKTYITAILTDYQIYQADPATIVYGCQEKGKGLLAVLNLSNSKQKRTIKLQDNMPKFAETVDDYFTGQSYKLQNNTLEVELAPYSSAVFTN